jgi:hypothetical protein
MRQSAVHLLDPEQDFAHVVTFGSSMSLPIEQSVAFTHAPAATPHDPPSSPGGSEASISPPAAPPDPAAPPVPVSPPAPAEPPDVAAVLVPAAPVEADDVEAEALAEPLVPVPSLLPPHPNRTAAISRPQRVPPNLWLDMEMLL